MLILRASVIYNARHKRREERASGDRRERILWPCYAFLTAMNDLGCISLKSVRILEGFFFHAEDGIRDADVTGVQTCALPISSTRNTDFTQGMSWAISFIGWSPCFGYWFRAIAPLPLHGAQQPLQTAGIVGGGRRR